MAGPSEKGLIMSIPKLLGSVDLATGAVRLEGARQEAG
jgi:hypothetical protein